MWVLGINSPPLGWHDPTACLVSGDGSVVALVEEERPTRLKHGVHLFPHRAVRDCLDIAQISMDDIDVVAVGWQLPMHSARTDLDGLDPPVPGRPWQFDDDAAFLSECLAHPFSAARSPQLTFVPHHHAHACSTFYASGFERAAILVIDGNGDDEAVSLYSASPSGQIVRRRRWPISVSPGYMYGAVSEMIGLSFLEAGKTMGLAAYGRARGVEAYPTFAVSNGDFTTPFALPSSAGWDEICAAWRRHFGAFGVQDQVRTPSEQLDRDDQAVRLAWSAQCGIELVVRHLVAHARELTGEQNICLAGGVALNCSTNGLLDEPVYVPPVPNDCGIALGAAWAVAPPSRMTETLSPYLGRSMQPSEIDVAVRDRELRTVDVEADDIATRLLRGELGAVAVGRAEVGPRALCHRSILAVPRPAAVRDRLNAAKGREPWRPLGPVGLADADGTWWSASRHLHQYMVGAAEVLPAGQDVCPAAAHVDETARPQIADDRTGLVNEVLQAMARLGAPPVLLNTSFNVRGEPIVDTPENAIDSARKIGLDFLVLNDRVCPLS